MKEPDETRPEPPLKPPKPGEELLEVLEMRHMSQAQLALRLGRPKRTVNEIVKGRTAITAETAVQLEHVLGLPAEHWLELEALHRKNLAAKRLEKRVAKDADWLDELPVDAMVKAGWLGAAETEAEQVTRLLRWFGVASQKAWHDVFVEPQAGYVRSPPFEADPGALAAWMRTGELQAGQILTEPYDRVKFLDTLERTRRLTIEPAAVWREGLIELAAEAGVAVAFSAQLAGAPVAGATRWLSPRKALIHLSLAFETEDQLWLTYFHQMYHLLFHGKKQVFLEGAPPVDADRGDDWEEEAADEFGSGYLVTRSFIEKLKPLCDSRRISETVVRTAAAELWISPGILVSRLQQLGWLPDDWFNDLKRPLEWPQPGTRSERWAYKG